PQAAEIETDSIIDAVLISPVTATITRTGTASLPPGDHSLIIRDLPGRLDPNRLVLRLDDQSVRIGNLRLRREFQDEVVGEEQQRLETEIEALRFERRQVTDGIASAQTQLQLLNSLASGSLGADEDLLSTDNLTGLLTTLVDAGNSARQSIREAEREVARLDIQIEQLQEQLAAFAARERSTQVATASLRVEAQTETDFSLSYPVQEASWSWQHEARLNSSDAFLQLTRNAILGQTSGEDWNDVELTITTVQGNRNINAPDINTRLVSLQSERPQTRNQRAFSTAARAADASVQEVLVTGAYLNSSVQSTSSDYQVSYRVPGRVSIASGAEQQIFPVDERGMDVELALVAVPELATAAFLEARFTMEDEIPIQDGQMQFYLDNSFIGSSYVGALLPGEEVSLPFGQDERIRVERLAEQEEDDSGGTFRRAAENVRQRYVLTSFHDQPVDIEILGMLPVSQSDDVEVEIDRDATEADADNIDGKRGSLMWQRRLQPTGTVEIRHFYSIRYPEGEQLDYRYD
ncbi:MAG: mucoidy inhibitor MuiA family protein, partial [Pseudomonadales bacterium]|nr:mucoidy inhibitor MuiA family protein [Pseudomonadales bacterium]